jgi:hypothetical protein
MIRFAHWKDDLVTIWKPKISKEAVRESFSLRRERMGPKCFKVIRQKRADCLEDSEDVCHRFGIC